MFNDSWNKIKIKILGHRPDEYSPADWAEMERLLDLENTAGSGSRRRFRSRWLRLLLPVSGGLLLVATVGAIAFFGLKTAGNTDANTHGKSLTHASTAQPDAGEEAASNGVFEQKNTGTQAAEKAVPPVFQQKNTGSRAAEKAMITQPATSGRPGRKQPAGVATVNENQETVAAAPDVAPEVTGQTAPEPAMHEVFEQKTAEETADGVRENLVAPGLLNALPLGALVVKTAPVPDAPAVNAPQPPLRRFLKQGLRFGALVGVNNSVTDSRNFRTSHLPFVGVFVAKTVSGRLEVQAEIHYKTVDNYRLRTKQFSYQFWNANGLPVIVSAQRSFQSFRALEFPVSLKYVASNRWSLLGGGRLSYRVDELFGSGKNGPNSNPAVPELPVEGFWKTDLGLLLGAEYFLGRHLLLDLRWTQGFRDLTPDNLYDDDAVHLNSDLQFSLRYIF